jgi:hypothetical protein
MITAKTTAKQTARAVRIWIEGAKPAASGFTPDASFSITHGDGFISLTLDPNGSRRVTKATRNGKARPIIDLHSAEVAAVFAGGTSIEVAYLDGSIMFTEAKS